MLYLLEARAMRLRHRVTPDTPAERFRLAFTIRHDDDDVKSCLDNPVGGNPQPLRSPRYEPYQPSGRGRERERDRVTDEDVRPRNNSAPSGTWSRRVFEPSRAFASSGARPACPMLTQTTHAFLASRMVGRNETGTTSYRAERRACS